MNLFMRFFRVRLQEFDPYFVCTTKVISFSDKSNYIGKRRFINMKTKIMWRYVLAWMPMVLIAIVNGLLRERFLTTRLKELYAHQVSTLILILLFGIYIWIVVLLLRPASSLQAVGIGLVWLGLTVVFEFLFGHYVAGHSWSKLLEDYNIIAGRLWILILIWVTAAPYLFYQLQR